MLLPALTSEERINEPGATMSTRLLQLEKSERSSVLVEEATVMAVEMQPGRLTAPSKLSLPAAISVAMPAPFNRSMIGLRLSASQALNFLASARDLC